ncbi:hypothetical protein [Clostridium beijerinckii]|uniref:hypothetical protein n=1 Tax=Clostridium beijerinckii TaxID=1520 RepID=UPI001570637A|nr:hypothetical protein [Clostridium beijerinckii]NRT54293.1 hypothetical protein [Clostridium beijerinckii]
MANGLCVKIKHVAKRHEQNNLRLKDFNKEEIKSFLRKLLTMSNGDDMIKSSLRDAKLIT